MPKEVLDEREFELINIIGGEVSANQRELSRQMNLSLGMVNMLIRRLISKGIIRIEQLNKRKVDYILTPKGFAEKMRKSIKYTQKTINSIGFIKNRAKEILRNLHQNGTKNFYVYAAQDLTTLIQIAYTELGFADTSLMLLDKVPEVQLEGVLLIGRENVELR